MLLCCLALTSLRAQEGVRFESLTLKEALEKAKKENRWIFLDAYTSWCGPCKVMAEQVFMRAKAGEFFNSRFVNVKYDMERGEGPELAKKFGIGAYPTFVLSLCVRRPVVEVGFYRNEGITKEDGRDDGWI